MTFASTSLLSGMDWYEQLYKQAQWPASIVPHKHLSEASPKRSSLAQSAIAFTLVSSARNITQYIGTAQNIKRVIFFFASYKPKMIKTILGNFISYLIKELNFTCFKSGENLHPRTYV